MNQVALLIGDPSRPPLSGGLVSRVALSLGPDSRTEWLSPGTAVQIFFASVRGPAEPRQALRHEVGALPVDIAVLPAEGRRKRLLVADMDSTIIEQECLDELAAEAGIKAQVASITERAMRGEIAFEPALRERVALLRGMDARAVERVLERVVPVAGAATLVATMRAHGAHTALVSGGFTSFTGPVSERLGFDSHRGNTLLAEEGRLMGRVQEPILGREAKLSALIELRKGLGLRQDETMAVGDGANDLAMIGEAGLGIAFRAKPAVAEAAEIKIDHGDLTALLYLQGYSDADFVASTS